MTGPAGEPAIRPVGPSDLEACLAIERAAYPNPWSRGPFEDLLALEPGLAIAAVDGAGRILGYALGWVVADEAELANLAVDPPRRRRGVGSALLSAFAAAAAARGARRIWLEVREGNGPARALYARRGFREVGRRRGYYDRPREDALVLAADPADVG